MCFVENLLIYSKLFISLLQIALKIFLYLVICFVDVMLAKFWDKILEYYIWPKVKFSEKMLLYCIWFSISGDDHCFKIILLLASAYFRTFSNSVFDYASIIFYPVSFRFQFSFSSIFFVKNLFSLLFTTRFWFYCFDF